MTYILHLPDRRLKMVLKGHSKRIIMCFNSRVVVETQPHSSYVMTTVASMIRPFKQTTGWWAINLKDQNDEAIVPHKFRELSEEQSALTTSLHYNTSFPVPFISPDIDCLNNFPFLPSVHSDSNLFYSLQCFGVVLTNATRYSIDAASCISQRMLLWHIFTELVAKERLLKNTYYVHIADKLVKLCFADCSSLILKHLRARSTVMC